MKLPAFLGQPLSLKNVGDVLCEFDDYYRCELIEIMVHQNYLQPSRGACKRAALEMEIAGVELRRTTGLLLALVIGDRS